MTTKKAPKANSTQPKRSGKPKPQTAPVAASQPDPVVDTPQPETATDKPTSSQEPQPSTDTSKRVVVRAQIFGHPVTAVLRWMGKENWTFDEARKAIDHFGAGGISPTTIRIQLPAGRKGQRGEPAPLTKEQAKELTAARN